MTLLLVLRLARSFVWNNERERVPNSHSSHGAAAAPAAGGVAFARLSLTAWLATMYEGFTRSYQASAASPDQWTFVRWMTQTSSRVVQMEEFYDRMHDKQWLLVPRREAGERFVEAVVRILHAPCPLCRAAR